MKTRAEIEAEINQVCLLQIGFRNGGLRGNYGVKVTPEEVTQLENWKRGLQRERDALLTPTERAEEAAMPF